MPTSVPSESGTKKPPARLGRRWLALRRRAGRSLFGLRHPIKFFDDFFNRVKRCAGLQAVSFVALGFDMSGFTETCSSGPHRHGTIPSKLDWRFSNPRPSNFSFGELQFAPEAIFTLNGDGDFFFWLGRATSPAAPKKDYCRNRENPLPQRIAKCYRASRRGWDRKPPARLARCLRAHGTGETIVTAEPKKKTRENFQRAMRLGARKKAFQRRNGADERDAEPEEGDQAAERKRLDASRGGKHQVKITKPGCASNDVPPPQGPRLPAGAGERRFSSRRAYNDAGRLLQWS